MTPDWMAAGAASAWLWKQYGKAVVDRATGGLHGKWKEFHSQRQWDKAAQAYRDALIRDHSQIRLLGSPTPVNVEDIFTDVYILDKVTAREYYDIQHLREQPPDRFRRYLKDSTRVNCLELVQHASSQRLFILGKPGAGKSTFLKYLILQAVNEQINKIPVFINLKDWSIRDVPLMDYLVRQFAICQFPDAQPFIEHLLQTGSALVLFDGLDEVNREGGVRDRITTDVEDFCRQYYQSQYIVTCRIAATEHAFQQFQDVELADFNDEQIYTFVIKWFADTSDIDNTIKRETFLEQFFHRDNESVRELGSIPILLTLLCITFDDTMSFPRRRADLYEEALDALLRKWDSYRSIKRDKVYRGLSAKLKQRLFAHIAAKAFEQGEQFFTERSLIGDIESFLSRLPPADTQDEIDGYVVLKSIEAQHSILVERAQKIYSFSHLTFQEYFTARYIADNAAKGTITSLLDQHSTDTRWREICLVTFSLLDEADDFFMYFQEKLDKIIVSHVELVRLFNWLEKRVQLSDSLQRYKLCLAYLIIYLIYVDSSNLSITSALALARALRRALAHDHTLAPAHNRTLALAQDRTLALAQDRTLALAQDRGRTFDLIPDLIFIRASIITVREPFISCITIDITLIHLWLTANIFAQFIIGNEVFDNRWVEAYMTSFADAVTKSQDFEFPTLTAALINLTVPTNSFGHPAWKQFADQLREVIHHERQLFPDIKLDKEDYLILEKYLARTKLLLECLDVATVNDRTAILACVLRPPVG